MKAEAARQSYPLQGIDVRTCDYFYAHRLKKLKEGRTKYNEL
jgi:hypothetical protein